MPRYNPAEIEPKWQAYWDDKKTFAAPRLPADSEKKFYALDMFPYPSGRWASCRAPRRLHRNGHHLPSQAHARYLGGPSDGL